MGGDSQQNLAKRSSRAARDFLRRLTSDAPVLLREVANLRDDGIARFQQRYSPFFSRYEKPELFLLRDELRALWTRGKKIAPAVALAWNDFLRREEKEKERAPQEFSSITLQEFICKRWLHRAHGGLVIFWEGRRREIGPDPYELPALLAYSAYLSGDRMRVCRNQDCPAPYFVAGRRDQRYCSAECAAPAKRAAKLRSWHRHKREWQRRRKVQSHAETKSHSTKSPRGGKNHALPKRKTEHMVVPLPLRRPHHSRIGPHTEQDAGT